MQTAADVLIVGAGIAGASAAWFAALAGRRPTLIDAGAERASDVPIAMINPLRGMQGRLLTGGPAGARFTFALVDRLRAAGHVVAAGRGLWRPVPDDAVRAAWAAQLPSAYPHAWHEVVPAELGLRGTWRAALYLPESGWVDARALVQALIAASGATVITARVAALAATGDKLRSGVVLDDGRTLHARDLVWCGGALGAHTLGGAALYRPGSVVTTAAPVCATALSYGLYAIPYGRGSIVGPSSETSMPVYPPAATPADVEENLLERAAAMFTTPVDVVARWRGVRLGKADWPRDLQVLGPYGARGFLLAPLQAHAFAQRHFGLRHGGSSD